MLGSRPSTGLGRIFDPPPERDVADELRGAYRDDAAEHGVQVQADRPFLEWAADVPEPKRPLDLDRFRFQRALYSTAGELARLVRVKKAAQVGVSAWLIRWALRRADLGATVLYVMPRLLQATEFSDMRLKPVLKSSAYLRARQSEQESPTDTKRLKTIGDGFLAVRGSKSEDELVSVDADALALDEYDRLTQANLPRVLQRVTGPMSQGLSREVSTPTLPNFGIAKGYANTDRRSWHVRCGGLDRRGRRAPGCGEWNKIAGMETFAELLDHERAVLNDEGRQIDGPPIALRCRKCRRELDVREGEWVAEFPDGDLPIGYHMPKFVVPGIDLAGIVHRSRATKDTARRAFHNEDLGEEWQSASSGLTDEQIRAATRDYFMDPGRYAGHNLVTMGVDVATTRALNVRVSEHLSEHDKKALWIGTVDDGVGPPDLPGVRTMTAFQILGAMMDWFRVQVAAIDQEPDGRLSRAFCQRFAGRAYFVAISGTSRYVISRPNAKGDPWALTVRQLEGLDATLDLIRQQANLLPAERPEGYDAQLKGRVLLEEEDDETGDINKQWVRVGPDDYLQAEFFDVVATHMAYVHRARAGAAAVSGQVVAGRPRDAVDDARPGTGLDYSAGPDDEPLAGWE